MKRILSLVFLLVVVVFGIVFAVLNAQVVAFNYYLGRTEMPLSLLLVAALIVGVALGVTASMTLVIRTRREAARLRRSAQLAEKEVMNLRALPLRDRH